MDPITPTTQQDRSAATRRQRHAPAAAHDRCRRIVERIADATGEAWTFGYIGDLTHLRDDRAWYAFRPHPGRPGTAADRIGGNATDDLDNLALTLAGALQMARMVAPR